MIVEKNIIAKLEMGYVKHVKYGDESRSNEIDQDLPRSTKIYRD